MLRARTIVVFVSILALAAALTGCAPKPLEKGSPEAAVQGLLELRSQLTTDPAEYASFVETSLAEALAGDSASRPETDVPIPEWKTPKRTEESSSAAKVTVTWKASKEFADWADATIFVLKREGKRWVVVDATDAAAKPASSKSTSAPAAP